MASLGVLGAHNALKALDDLGALKIQENLWISEED